MATKKRKVAEAEMSPQPGPSVDALGNPAIDPTKNVLDLVEAAVTRLDDLFAQDQGHRKEIDAIRQTHALEIRALQKDLREAESARINAIRAVDVGAVQRAAEVQADVATALANQVALSAETLRNMVSDTATATATALQTTIAPILTAVEELRRAQYEAQGQKTQVVESRAAGGSFGMWVGVAVGGLALFFSIVIGVISIVIVLTGR